MKRLIIAALGALALGGYFHDDLGRMISQAAGGRSQSTAPVVDSMKGLGGSMNTTMGGVGRTLGG